MSDFKDESIPLLAVNEQSGAFQLTQMGKQFLMRLNRPLAIVTIAGLYRTGKSYLLNKLVRSKHAFRTGNTTNSVTKGLNLWGQPLLATNSRGEEIYYIVVDSEGIGSCEQQNKYDLKLLMLIFLISSTVVYNSVGAIDETAIEQLRVVLSLKQCISNSMEKTKLVWILRDFALQLIDKNGKELSEGQYLQSCLQESSASTIEGKKKNEIRKAIKCNLGKRSCYTLVRPTMREEDLADLSKCKLRSEFMEQIELIKADIFSGDARDLKRIKGETITGPILISMLGQYIRKINEGMAPVVEDIWQSVQKRSQEQFIQSCCKQLERQCGKIVLPMSEQELQSRLNEVENRIYKHFEQHSPSDQAFRKKHRQFIKFTQKINADLKKSNRQLRKAKTLKEIRDYVEHHIPLDEIQPTNITAINFDPLQLRLKGEIDGYEYVLNVISDALHISEQKSIYLKQQHDALVQAVQKGQNEKRSSEHNVGILKQNYQQCLKTIANLKNSQEQLERSNGVLRSQHGRLELKLKSVLDEEEGKEADHQRQMSEAHLKHKVKIEQLHQAIQKLRKENNELIEELQEVKARELESVVKDKKEVIFVDKMKQTWGKFDEERKYLRGELDKFKADATLYRLKFEETNKSLENQREKRNGEQEQYRKRERQFLEELKEMKLLHAETKKTYCDTYDTIKDNDRIFRNIQNVVGHSRQRRPVELEKCRQESEEIKCISEELSRMSAAYEEESCKRRRSETELQKTKQLCEKLQEEIAATSQKFMQSLSQIESAKEKERTIYEQSIVRLLNNLETREGVMGSSRFYTRH